MVVNSSSSTSRFRRKSPLCADDYRRSLDDLPRVIPPTWMRTSLILGASATVLITILTLISPMDEYVTAPGEVRPADFTYVFSRATGIIETIEIYDGQPVKKGQVLARLDGWEIRKQIDQIDGEIAQATAELALAQASARKVAAAPVPPEFLFSAVEVDRQKEIQGLQQDYLQRLTQLQKSGAASGTETLNLRLQLIASESLLKRSQQAYELFKGDYGSAALSEATQRQNVISAQIESLKSSHVLAEKDLARLEIVAPEDGIILTTARRFPGEKIDIGTPLFKITDALRTELRLYATEDRVNLIEPGQFVRFRANNNPDRLAPLATGKVAQVARDRDLEMETSTAANAPLGTYRVTVTIDDKTPYPLAVGATVQAEIILGRRSFWQILLMKPNPEAGKQTF